MTRKELIKNLVLAWVFVPLYWLYSWYFFIRTNDCHAGLAAYMDMFLTLGLFGFTAAMVDIYKNKKS